MNFLPANKVFVEIDQEFNDELITQSGIKFYLDPSYNKEWNCQSVGVVNSLPKYVKKENEDVLSKLNIGDKILFSYRIVSDVEFSSDRGQFMDISPTDSPTYKQYSSPQGESILVRMLPSAIGNIWVGVHQNKRGEFIDGSQGSESQVMKWLANYSLGKTDNYTFRNLLKVNGKDVWKVEFQDIFAKKIDGGKWVSISDRVLLEPIDIDITDAMNELNKISLPQSSVQARFYDRAVVTSTNDKSININDIVSFEEKYLEKYEVDGKHIFLVKERRIGGKWIYPKIITNV